MIRRPLRLLTALLLAAATVACTPHQQATPPQSSVSVPPIPGTGLHVDRVTADPCAAVTLDQLHDIGFTGGQQQAGSDRRCTARFDATTTVSLWIDGATLAYLYTERARGHSGGGNHFDPITIDTYPAVITYVTESPGSTGTDTDTCTIALGARDDTLINIAVDIGYASTNPAGPWKKDARGAAQKITALVVANLSR